MTWIYITITVYLSMACIGQGASGLKVKSSNATFGRLAEYLMDGYNNGVRPVKNWSQSTTVIVDITIFAILGVDEKNQALTTYIWQNQTWIDEFLTWDPMEFDNVTKISIPTKWIWVPDLTVIESVTTEKTGEISYVYLTHNGRIFNNKPVQLVTACSLKIYYFPFDQQNCSISFGSWIHTQEDVNLDFSKNVNSRKVPPLYYDNDGEWDLVEIVAQRREFVENENLSFSETKFFIVIKRRSLFYVINLILPSMFLIIMDAVGFYLPPESGERVSFKITLLLGYSVFLIIASDQLPATGTPLIGVYFIMCLIMMVISLTESILMVRIVHNQNLHPTVPMWLKKLVFGKMSLLVCLKGWVQFVAPRENSSRISDQTDSSTEKLEVYEKDNIGDEKQLSMTRDQELLLSIRNEVVSIQKHLKKKDHETIIMEWLQIGYIVDKFLFRAYLIVLFVLSVSLGAAWAQAQWYRQ